MSPTCACREPRPWPNGVCSRCGHLVIWAQTTKRPPKEPSRRMKYLDVRVPRWDE